MKVCTGEDEGGGGAEKSEEGAVSSPAKAEAMARVLELRLRREEGRGTAEKTTIQRKDENTPFQ